MMVLYEPAVARYRKNVFILFSCDMLPYLHCSGNMSLPTISFYKGATIAERTGVITKCSSNCAITDLWGCVILLKEPLANWVNVGHEWMNAERIAIELKPLMGDIVPTEKILNHYCASNIYIFTVRSKQ